MLLRCAQSCLLQVVVDSFFFVLLVCLAYGLVLRFRFAFDTLYVGLCARVQPHISSSIYADIACNSSPTVHLPLETRIPFPFTCFVIKNVDPIIWTMHWSILHGGPYLKHTWNIVRRYIKCSESSRLSLLQYIRVSAL